MSKLSIYETRWIDLVFQYRNKEYGAYQLRRESTKTSIMALFMGILLLTSALSIPVILNYFNPGHRITLPELTKTLVHITDIIPNPLAEIEKPALPQVKAPNSEAAIPSDQLVNPEIVAAQLATQEIPKNTDNTTVTTTSTEGTAVIGINPSGGTGTETSGTVDPGNTIVASATLDKLPEFPGGINKFYTYVGNNFESPAIDSGGTIKVYVSFVIEKDGSMTDIHVQRDPGYGLGKEAVRVLKSLRTKWSPGMIGSKPVRTAYNLPITVQLN